MRCLLCRNDDRKYSKLMRCLMRPMSRPAGRGQRPHRAQNVSVCHSFCSHCLLESLSTPEWVAFVGAWLFLKKTGVARMQSYRFPAATAALERYPRRPRLCSKTKGKTMEGFVIFTLVPSDGYRVARFVVAVGTAIKVLAVMAAIAMLFVKFSAYRPEFRVPTSIILAGLGWAAVVGFAGFVIGVFVSAGGQLLRARFDCAVNSSPFFSNQQRAQIMSIPVDSVDYNSTPPDASPVRPADFKLIAVHKSSSPTGGPSTTATERIRCPKCGSTNVLPVKGEDFSFFQRRGCKDCGLKWA